MKKFNLKIKKIYAPLASLAWVFSFSLAYAQDTVYEQASGPLQNMINVVFGGGVDENVNVNTGAGGDSFLVGLFIIVNYLLTFVGVIFFLILIYGGYLWMAAQGNEDQVIKAKKITTDAILGIIVIFMARIIVEFILYQIGQSIQVQ